MNLLHKENSKPTSDRALEGIGLWISNVDGRGGSEAAGRAEVALTRVLPYAISHYKQILIGS